YNLGDYSTSAEIARRSIRVSPGEQTHALSLLAFSLLQLGDRKGPNQILQRILASDPSSVSTRLGCAEIALAGDRFDDAEREVLDVISGVGSDGSIISWALQLLGKIWRAVGPKESHLASLLALPDHVKSSPAFLELLAGEQRAAGM